MFTVSKAVPFIFYLGLSFSAIYGTALAGERLQTVEQWRRVDITLISLVNYSHPDTDVSIRATFTGPQGSTITLPGFWDGGTTWKVRFAPPKTGHWSYVVNCSDTSNAGLHAQKGGVQCNPYTGNIPIYQHGFLKVSPDGRRFTYADGTPFFWLADTHWQMPDYERIDECNFDNCGNQFTHLVNDRLAKGFTVYQTYPDSAENDGGGNIRRVNWWSEKYTHLDPKFFREKLDVMMDYMADHGLVICLGVGVHTQTAKMGPAALEHFTEYMVARYASYPVVWFVGQEVDVGTATSLAIWKKAAETINRFDGYNHPLGAHMDSVAEPKTFGHEKWHDWFPTQGGHTVRGIRTKTHYKSYWDFTPTKPFLETEAMYEEVEADGFANTKAMRMAAWKAMQCGSYGYSYGVTGVWAMKWDVNVAGWDGFNLGGPWYVGMNRPGSTQLSHLKNFYTAVGFQDLVPRFSDGSWGAFANEESSVISTAGSDTYVVYFYDSDTRTGVLKNLRGDTTYKAQWFDPRSATYSIIAESIVSDDGTYTIPPKPDADDWVLLVTDKK